MRLQDWSSEAARRFALPRSAGAHAAQAAGQRPCVGRWGEGAGAAGHEGCERGLTHWFVQLGLLFWWTGRLPAGLTEGPGPQHARAVG